MADNTLVYDDDCGFCTWWAEFFETRSPVRIVGFSELSTDEKRRLPDDYEDCAHLIADGRLYSCGEAMEQTFVRSSFGESARPVISFLRNFSDYDRVREALYREVADRRDVWGTFVSKDPPAKNPRENRN